RGRSIVIRIAYVPGASGSPFAVTGRERVTVGRSAGGAAAAACACATVGTPIESRTTAANGAIMTVPPRFGEGARRMPRCPASALRAPPQEVDRRRGHSPASQLPPSYFLLPTSYFLPPASYLLSPVSSGT